MYNTFCNPELYCSCADYNSLYLVPREARLINPSGRRPDRSESRAKSSEKYIYIHIYLYISMKVSVLSPGNSPNTVWMTSDKGKAARQQQVGRQSGVRGNLQLLCNRSKAARTGNYKRKPLPHNGALMFIHWGHFKSTVHPALTSRGFASHVFLVVKCALVSISKVVFCVYFNYFCVVYNPLPLIPFSA